LTTEGESHIIRTSGGRFGKGLIIIVVLMAIGAGINLSFGDFWHKYPPANQLKVHEGEVPGGVTLTGETLHTSLKFVESSDFRNLGFNAVMGEANANPDIIAHVGDRVEIELENGGKMPHAFGVVSDPDDPNTIVFKSALKSPSDPLKSGASGEASFIVDKEGEYYYICTVPGHAALGMKGKLIVQAAGAAGGSSGETVKPTGISHTFDLAFTESADLRTLGFNAVMGEANANPEIRVKAGDSVTVNVVNNGKMPHAFGVVSDPDEPVTIMFNAKIKSADNPLLKGQSESVTFTTDRPGHFYYICTVPGHAALGMKGDFIIE
jgi:nitrite reductase (NO-forming)